MALYATNRFHGDGATTSYEFNFVGKYIARTHVKVYQEDNATKVRTYVSINDSNFLNDTTLRSLPVTPVGSTLVVYRETPKPPIVDFVNGSRFTEYNLDLVARQGLFVAMEAMDAGDAEARQQLLDAITVIAGLSDDATAAALAAATSASNAASSASTANTQATNAATSATNAANAAAAAGNSVAAVTPMACRVVVVNAASRIVRLERCGGTAMTIGATVRTIPAGGVDITLPAGSAPLHIYAGLDGSTITLSADAVSPMWNATYGRWVKASSTDTVVAYVLPDGLATPERFLRNYYNGPGVATYTQTLTSDYTANWDGVARQLISMPILILPGDSIDMFANASIMSTPISRVGDLMVRLNGVARGRARNTHTGETFAWRNYSCHGGVIQRGPGHADPAQQATLELSYLPISSNGATFTVLGDGISTALVANITPYKFA